MVRFHRQASSTSRWRRLLSGYATRSTFSSRLLIAQVAEMLKPYYTYGCKRPTFHDDYLPTFNLPHVHLVDTSPSGVTEITPRGVCFNGREYELDVIVYGTGFKVLEHALFDHVRDGAGRSLGKAIGVPPP